MTFVTGLMLALWLLAIALTLYGTFCALRNLTSSPPHLDAPYGLYPVSILKPLKGADNGIRENIKSFFELDYPSYELLFSVADATDPARFLVEDLIDRYPWVDAKLVVGAVEAGPNPKVNNLVRTYDMAKHDLILISDSNVRVPKNYLKRVTAHLENGIGVITAAVAGRDAESFGGMLEATYLNTFYARWMHLSTALNQPTVVGKSMLFSRKTAARFGGIRAMARYLAEDYMTGIAMKRLGLRTVIQSDAVHQHIGKYSFADFWARHIRWGRIRKSQAPAAFMAEPLVGPVLSAIAGAIAATAMFPSLSVSEFLTAHFGLWSLCDLAMAAVMNKGLRMWMPIAWLARELLALPMWAHTALGNTVLWRGRTLALQSGGLLTDRA